MRAAIVGGGIGGLTTALMLSQKGVKVSIYERSSQLGGRLAFHTQNGEQIDQGPTIVLIPEQLLGLLEKAGISRERLELLRCDPMYRIHYADGTVFHKWSDLKQQQAEVERCFPGEGASFAQYMADMAVNYKQGRRDVLERSFQRKHRFFTPRNLQLLTRMKVHQTVQRAIASYFRDPRLVDAYSLQTLYIGGGPHTTPALYSLLPYAEQEHGVWYLKGGYASLVTLIEQELRERNVTIYLEQEVCSLLIKDDVCVGLETGIGEGYYDAVIYNGEIPELEHFVPSSAKKRRRYTPSSACLLLYMGVDRRFEHAAAHQFYLPPSLRDTMHQVFNQHTIPDTPSYYVFNPVAVDADAAPEGQSVLYVLIPVPSLGDIDWEVEAEPLAQKVIADAEQRGFPGLQEAVRWLHIRTPEDAKRMGLFEGGSFGIAPTLLQSGPFRPQLQPYPIQRLYAVGASVHPGGGVPIVMQSAALLVDHLAEEMRVWNN